MFLMFGGREVSLLSEMSRDKSCEACTNTSMNSLDKRSILFALRSSLDMWLSNDILENSSSRAEILFPDSSNQSVSRGSEDGVFVRPEDEQSATSGCALSSRFE